MSENGITEQKHMKPIWGGGSSKGQLTGTEEQGSVESGLKLS